MYRWMWRWNVMLGRWNVMLRRWNVMLMLLIRVHTTSCNDFTGFEYPFFFLVTGFRRLL